MMISTHKLLARILVENIDEEKKIMIKETHFIWGNIKPDFASKYKLRKHYPEESLDMVIDKIIFLSSLKLNDIYKIYSINKFNQELGVICHFLCDFYCVPHNQRWEFKNAGIVKDHLKYEKELNKVAKSSKFSKSKKRNLNSTNVRKFIIDTIDEYEKNESYANDIKYSVFVCNSVLNMILCQIIGNELRYEFG